MANGLEAVDHLGQRRRANYNVRLAYYVSPKQSTGRNEMDEKVEVRRSGYTVLQDWVIDREDLTSSEKLAYMALCRHASKQGECWPSYQTIAKKMSVSRKTAKVAVQGLVKKGIVKYSERKNDIGHQTSHLYTITDTDGGGGVMATRGWGNGYPGVGSQLPPKDSHSKDSQGRQEESPPPDGLEISPPVSKPDAITHKEVSEWTADITGKSISTDDRSLAALRTLSPDKSVIRKALCAWLRDESPGSKRLGWFVKQSYEHITTAQTARDELQAGIARSERQAAEYLREIEDEKRRRASLTPEQRAAEDEEADRRWAKLKASLSNKPEEQEAIAS